MGGDFARVRADPHGSHGQGLPAINGVSFAGDILSASLAVTFLDTAKTRGDTNESFFDYSGGPEDFALLSAYAAQTIETASAGVTTASDTVVFTTDTSTAATYVPPPTSGAPAPPLPVLLGLAALVLWRMARG